MSPVLARDQLDRDLAVRDLTDPAEGPHAIQLLIDVAVGALAAAWGGAVCTIRGPRIVSLADNYDHLRYPAEAVTRDARYTRYVDEGHVLRSHTSAMVPPALRTLAAETEPPGDLLLACPGIAYRRDSIDRLHTGTPHQLDLWRITRAPMADDDLDGMLHALADALVPGRPWRWEPRVHPYLNGRQVDIGAGCVPERNAGCVPERNAGCVPERNAGCVPERNDSQWVEVWECGLAHPEVLARAGLRGWSGLALGMGLDRLLQGRPRPTDAAFDRPTRRRPDARPRALPACLLPARGASRPVGGDRRGRRHRGDRRSGPGHWGRTPAWSKT